MTTIKIDLGKSNPASKISEDIIKSIIEKVSQNQIVDRKELASKLTVAVKASYLQAIRFAIKNMIGAPSPKGALAQKVFTTNPMASFGKISQVDFSGIKPTGAVYWQALAYDTMKKKGHNKFFIDSGRLISKLTELAPSIVDNTGVISILPPRDEKGHFIKFPKKVPLGSLHFRLLPKISPSLLPGLAANSIQKVDRKQAFENIVVNDSEVLQKLHGPTDIRRQRPLLQPVFNFWTKYYVPGEIRKVLRNL